MDPPPTDSLDAPEAQALSPPFHIIARPLDAARVDPQRPLLISHPHTKEMQCIVPFFTRKDRAQGFIKVLRMADWGVSDLANWQAVVSFLELPPARKKYVFFDPEPSAIAKAEILEISALLPLYKDAVEGEAQSLRASFEARPQVMIEVSQDFHGVWKAGVAGQAGLSGSGLDSKGAVGDLIIRSGQKLGITVKVKRSGPERVR